MIDNILAENLGKFTANADVFKHAIKNTNNLTLFFNKNGLLLDDKQVLAILKKSSLTEALEIIAKVKDTNLLKTISKIEKRKTVLSQIILNKFCDDVLAENLLFNALETNNRHIVENIFNTKTVNFFQNVYLKNNLTSFEASEAKTYVFKKLNEFPENFLKETYKKTLKNLSDNHFIIPSSTFDSFFNSDFSFETKISIWEEFALYFIFSTTSLKGILKTCFSEKENLSLKLTRIKAQQSSYSFYSELRKSFKKESSSLTKKDFFETFTTIHDFNSLLMYNLKENEVIDLEDYEYLKNKFFTNENEEELVNTFISCTRTTKNVYTANLKEYLLKRLFEFTESKDFFNFKGDISLLENLNDYTYAVKVFDKFDRTVLFSDSSLLENLFENGADEFKLLQSFSESHLHYNPESCLRQRAKCVKYDLKFKQETINNLFIKSLFKSASKTVGAEILTMDLISEEQILKLIENWETAKTLFDTVVNKNSYIEILTSRKDFSLSTRFILEVFAYSRDIWFRAPHDFEVTSVYNEDSLKVINSLKGDFKETFFSRLINYCTAQHLITDNTHIQEWITYAFENVPRLNDKLNSTAEEYLQKLLCENFETLSTYDTFYSLLPSWEGTIKELINVSKTI